MLLYGRFCHGKGIMPPLEMVMAQDGSSHNGKVRIGTQEIMGELLDKVKQLSECRLINFHGHMLSVEHDAVLIVVHIWGILESPLTVIDGNGNDSVVIPGRMVGPPRIPHVLHAQLAFWIAALPGQLGRRNGLWILFRFGQVYRNVQRTVAGIRGPLHISCNAVTADIIGILAETIIPVRCFLRRLLIAFPEFLHHLTRPWHQAVHQLRVKKVPVNHAVLLKHARAGSAVQKLL